MLKWVFFFREKIQWYFRETVSKNMYTKKVENEKIVNLELGGFIEYLKLMNFVFLEKRGWRVISPL